jgi:Cof subfamily protein (haloacid dehalogenase superfamily)
VKEDGGTPNLPAFSHPPGAIALDIDGTLLDSKSRLSARNAAAVGKCLAKGVPVIIATSRPARAVRRLLGTAIMNACSLVMQNGAIGIGAPPLTGKVKETIPPEIVDALVQALLETEPAIHLTAELEGYEFGTNNPRDEAVLWQVNSAAPEMQLTLEEALKKHVTKIAAGGLGRSVTDIAEKITERFKDTLSVIVGDGVLMNITLKTATKSNTLRRLLRSQNIVLADVLAIGDDLPDLDMLSACGIPIAVANARPQVKALCKYRTLSNDEDGVAVVLEKILEENPRH